MYNIASRYESVANCAYLTIARDFAVMHYSDKAMPVSRQSNKQLLPNFAVHICQYLRSVIDNKYTYICNNLNPVMSTI